MNNFKYKSKIKSLKPDESDAREERRRYLAEEFAWADGDFRRLTCDSADYQVEIDVRLKDRDDGDPAAERHLNANECRKRCIVTVQRDAMCSNKEMTIEYNVRLTFWLYLVIRVFIGQYVLVSATVSALRQFYHTYHI